MIKQKDVSNKSNNGHNKKPKKCKKYTDKKSEGIKKIIHDLTRSGSKSLNPEMVTEVVDFCMGSECETATAFDLIMENLEQRHAEIRFSAFQLIDQLVRRVDAARPALVKRVERVLHLTTGKDTPKPVRVARDLRMLALLTLREWSALFGRQHFRLKVAYEYMRDVEKVDFASLARERSAAESVGRMPAERNRPPPLNPVAALRVKRVMQEIEDKEEDVRTAAVSLTNCINLLLPHPDDFFIVSDTEENEPSTSGHGRVTSEPEETGEGGEEWSGSDEGAGDAPLREVGVAGPRHSIQLEFTPSYEVLIVETEENAAIIENARDCAKLIGNKYLPVVKAWLEVLSKSREHEEKQKCLKELKGELEDLLFKFGRLKFGLPEDSSSDSDFEEVPEKSERNGESKKVETKEWCIVSDEKAIGDPMAATQAKLEAGSFSERKRRLLAVAPKRPFDVDLYHWEDEELTAPTLIPSSTEGHRFWASEDGVAAELAAPGGVAALRTRVIEFSGVFAPVNRSCRVRLPSGRLCPRRDRVKCPFHGEIVPRDETGSCVNAKDAMRLRAIEERRQRERPDWQHPRLLADIKRATGIDLKMPEKGKRKKRKTVEPGLTDLKELDDTSTKRLEKKIFNRSAMKRVASALDRADQRKLKDKFGEQFHYFYS